MNINYSSIYKCLNELEAELNIKEDILPEQSVSESLAPCPSVPKAPFPLRDEDGETIITRTAKLINEGKQNPYETEWMDVTLFDANFTEELLKIINTDLLKIVGQAMLDEENRYDTLHGRFYEVSSNYYRCGNGDWYSHTVDTWNNNDEYISPLSIAEAIYDQRKKAKEYEKRKTQNAVKQSNTLKDAIDTVCPEFTSLAKGRTISELIKASRRSADFVPPSHEEVEVLCEKLTHIDHSISDEELNTIVYHEVKNKNISLEEDWIHASTRCCELHEENTGLHEANAKLKDENAKLRKELRTYKKHDEVYYFCDFIRRYMNSNKNKPVDTRKEVRKSINDIMTHLKMDIPKELQAALNQFDDEQQQKEMLDVIEKNTEALLKLASRPSVGTVIVEQNNHGVSPQITNRQQELLSE